MTDALVALLLGLLDRAAAAGALLMKTRAEGREPTPAEFQALFDADTIARDKLDALIKQKRAQRGTP